jgi:N utilization substance protein B
MISRRNIRVKVMQLIYALEALQEQMDINSTAELKKQFNKSHELFLYLIYWITEMSRYVETDARLRAAKNITTESDLHVNTKIAGNEILWQILESDSFKSSVNNFHFQERIDNDLLKKLYQELSNSSEYQSYIALQLRDKKSEKNVIQYIFTDILLINELFQSHIEELFNNWDDDCEMMEQLILNFLHKPLAYNLNEIISAEKFNFANNLLNTVLLKKQVCLDLIVPKLNNWGPDRIAILDMIIIRMGLCELLYFETIPTKVTINEYIDLAKDYSTQQSGNFVNGILDNIHKELLAQGKINKIAFISKARK